MSTFAQLKNEVRSNLGDQEVSFYSSDEMDASFQDAYDDVVANTQCIIKKTTLAWIANAVYLDFLNAYGLTDYMATTAIFDNVSNRWLRDDLSSRDFLKFRPDWEIQPGSPQFWAPKASNLVIVYPHYTTAIGTFDLYYYAMAPTIDDNDTPLIPSDKQCLLQQYATADLLETAEEFTKAKHYWDQYYDEGGLIQLAERIKNISKSDLLMLA